MRKVSNKKVVAAVLACSMALSTAACGRMGSGVAENVPQVEALASGGDADGLTDAITDSLNISSPANTDKEETVYVIADEYGNPTKTIDSVWLKNTDKKDKLEDVSELKDIENVKGDEAFSKSGNKISWDANGNDIYYQGKTDKEIPVAVKVTYFLDDKEIDAKDLAGKAGSVKIRFDYTNKAKEGKVYVPFIMATGFLLSADNFSNVEVTNGKVISDGGHFIVIGMGLPGLKSSLDLEKIDLSIPDYFEVTADTTDFEMNMAVTVATTTALSDKDFDAENLESRINELTSKYGSGMNDLAKGIKDYTDGASKVSDGAASLSDGADRLSDGCKDLDAGAVKLDAGAASLFEGAKAAANGSLSLSLGAAELSDGLSRINEQVQGINIPGKESFAAATNLSDEEKAKVEEDIQKEAGRLGAPDKDSLAASITESVTKAVQGSITAETPELAKAAQAGENAASVIASTGKAKGEAIGAGEAYIGADGQSHVITDDARSAAESAVVDLDKETALGTIDALASDQINALKSQMVEANTALALQNKAKEMGLTVEELKAAVPGIEDQIRATVENEVEASIADLELGLFKAGYGSGYGQGYGTGFATGYGTGYAAEYANLAKEFSVVISNISTNLTTTMGALSGTITGLCKIYAEAGCNVTLAQMMGKVVALSEQYSAKIDTLKKYMDAAANGAADLAAGSLALAEGNRNVADGAAALKYGTSGLKDGTGQLNSGAATLKDGAAQLKNGAKELTDNNAKLNDGAAKLNDATKELLKAVDNGEADMDELVNKFNSMRKAADDYQSFSGILDGKKGNVKFIIKTDGVTKDN